MEVTITIPDKIAEQIMNGKEISRALLESLAVEGCREGLLTTFEVREMLGFDTRMEVDEFLKKRGVFIDYTEEEIEEQRQALRHVLSQKLNDSNC